jgi:hypothetical protein
MTTTNGGGVLGLAMALMLGATAPALAQNAAPDPHHPETAPQAGSEQDLPDAPQPGPDRGMMMMDPGMMRQMMGHGMGPGMMQPMPQGMPMQPSMMGPGTMGEDMGPEMMGQDMRGHGPMGFRIVPVMHLSTEDVQHYLEHYIERHGFQHLKVGDVRQAGDDTITADLVTEEGSLAIRLEVDPHTGLIRKFG